MYYISARVLNRAVKRGVFRKVTFKQRFEEGEDLVMSIPGGRMFGWRNGCRKGTKVGACLWS